MKVKNIEELVELAQKTIEIDVGGIAEWTFYIHQTYGLSVDSTMKFLKNAIVDRTIELLNCRFVISEDETEWVKL